MSYLLDLLKSFNADELEQFRQLDLTGKQEQVRDVYAAYQTQPGFDEALLPQKLQLSRSHFDKINSLLLDKCITHFAGANVDQKFQFLVDKQVTDLTLHELKVHEKKAKKEGGPETLKKFYELAARITILFNFNNYPIKEIFYYTEAYIQMLSESEAEEKYRIMARHEEMLIRYYYPRKEGAAQRNKSLKKLLKWQVEIEGKGFFVAEVRICLGLSSYYESSEPRKGLFYLQEADKVARKAYDKISDREKAFILAMSASLLVDLSRFQEAIEVYKELFEKFPALASTRIFHPFQYVFGLLIVEDFVSASEVIEKYLRPFLENKNARNFHFDILRLYAVYHLLKGETDKAGNYLQRILQFGKEDFTPLGDVLFRFVHNVYCIQTGNYSLAADVLKKNIKFTDAKIDIQGFTAYKQMFLDLGKVIRFKAKGATGSKPFPLHEIAEGEGLARLYQNLIRLPLRK